MTGGSPDEREGRGMEPVGGTLELNDGRRIPRLGLGVFQIPAGEATERAVAWAFEAGYRHIDTAKLYRNEASVGAAVRHSGLAREEVFVTTKLWVTDEWSPRRGLEASLSRLGLDYVDLYLIHFPVPGLWRRAWQQMEPLAAGGRARSVGVSNVNARQLSVLLASSALAPAVDQVRASPFGYDRELYELCRQRGVAFEAYSPLTQGKRLDDGTLAEIAARHGATPAQVCIAWALHKGMVVIPKSAAESRIRQNAAAADLVLDSSDLAALDQLSS
jgi:diketogulonate reductase-like aldo/keto reductase